MDGRNAGRENYDVFIGNRLLAAFAEWWRCPNFRIDYLWLGDRASGSLLDLAGGIILNLPSLTTKVDKPMIWRRI